MKLSMRFPTNEATLKQRVRVTERTQVEVGSTEEHDPIGANDW